jgi:phosphopantothenoylcysteine decarboxylase/phosphopantothenate--cysteine ligase
MTDAAVQFVAPLTFETLSGNAVVTGLFEKKAVYDVRHVSLSKAADIFVVAPATADLIARYAGGIADDFLTTALLAVRCPVLLAPAMNAAMLAHSATDENISVLSGRGVSFIYGGEGRLACGDTGAGRMAEPVDIVDSIIAALTPKNDLAGRRVLVTAGATVEDIDRVRFISNYSSGKMGVAVAAAAYKRGARVTLVAGALKVAPPEGVAVVYAKSTADTEAAVLQRAADADIIIMAGAPADYRVETVAPQKIKAQSLTLKLVKNPDIAAAVGRAKADGNTAARLVIFCAETEKLIENASAKLAAKNADMAVANDVTREGAGFDGDTNIATLIMRDGTSAPLPVMSKTALADIILDGVLKL